MKKVLHSLVLALGLSMSANAGINVTVSALTGFYLSDDTTGLLANSPNGWVQIIYFGSGSASSSVLPGGTVGVNETILAQFSIKNTIDSDDYGIWSYDLVSPQTSGSWYARVFEGGSSTTGASADNIVIGTWYYQSAIYSVINNTTPETPELQSVQGNNPTVLQSEFGGDFVNFQVVPEPSVLAFLGLGGLALAARRRFIA